MGSSLVGLLGQTRAEIVERLVHDGPATTADLAEALGISTVATRKHLALMADEELVEADTVKQERGRPARRWHLTTKGRQLLPQRNADVATELFEFITSEHGREGIRDFLRWRLDKQSEALGEAVTADEVPDRLEQLAGALSEAGFDASVSEDGEGFTLQQDHCAILDVARDHPELCTYEAAAFSRVLGNEVTLSRRQTLAGGHDACVCSVTPKTSTATASKESGT
ncbi:MAG: ArsR family transcriptional regulator [Nitriliruptorales bacterium]|nr:ArsR family transcriptional regulator [Nitriliruptorales bacterium]